MGVGGLVRGCGGIDLGVCLVEEGGEEEMKDEGSDKRLRRRRNLQALG